MRQTLHLLLIEDSEQDARFLLRELRRGGYDLVSERVDTPEGVAAALDGDVSWDAILSDYYMGPDFRAPDALALVQERGLDLPFIIVSGAVGEDAAVAAMRAGAHDYVMKNNLARLGPAIERELREAEVRRERRRAEEKYRSLFENSAEGIFQTTGEGRIRTANPAMARIFGYESPEELISSVTDIGVQLYADPGRQGEFAEEMRRHGAVFGFEARARRKDGSIIWVSLNARAVYDEAGELAGYEGAVEDVSERKQAEESLRCSLDMLFALHEAGRMLGSTLELEKIGPVLLEIMQRASSLRAAVIHMRDEDRRWHAWHTIGSEDLWRPARRKPEAIAARRLALQTGEHRSFRLPRQGPEGETLVGLCLPLHVRDQTFGVLEAYGPETLLDRETVDMLRSLTAQAASALENAQLYQELAEREHRLQELVGEVLIAQEEERRRVAYEVHDGLAQLAAAAHQHLQAFAQRQHRLSLAQSRENLERILNLVRQTVGEARRIIADLRPTALDDLGLAAALALEVDRLNNDGWQVDYEEELGDERLPTAVETALFRVAQEALTNTRKHAGTKRVRLAIRRLGEDVLLEVRDRGRGFDPTALDGGDGPGERVGLSGMRERIGMLGGELEIRSRPGLGTSISVKAPLPAPTEDGRLDAEAYTMDGHRVPTRVVIVDDQDIARAGLRDLLSDEPTTEVVGEAANGREALALCARVRPDLVLMDVRMPEMDGLAATRAIKREHPKIIVMMVTMHENPDYLFEALKAGAAGYVLKDATQDRLISAIRRALSGESPLNQELATRLLRRLIRDVEEHGTPPREPEERPRARQPVEPLTSRELEVLELIVTGKTNRQIAEDLVLSTHTVKVHVQHVIAKLGVSDRTQAAALAVEMGLFSSTTE